MQYEILGNDWLTTNMGPTLGVVAIKSYNHWKAYIGIARGNSEIADLQLCAGTGAKLPKQVACAWFPHLNPDEWPS